MSTQVERLQALLQRVQENRGRLRVAGEAPLRANAPAMSLPVQAHAAARPRPDSASFAGFELPPAAAPAEHRPEPRVPDRSKPGATPLEMAFEDQFNMPPLQVAQPVPSQPKPPPQPQRAASRPAELMAAAAPVGAGTDDGFLLADPEPPKPSKPVAQVISKQPPMSAPSFGELLRRSLSLRPR